MKIKSSIVSSYYGTVAKIFHYSSSSFRESEPLFLISITNGLIKEIVADSEGMIRSCEVCVGDEVIPGMVLAYTEEDLSVIGKKTFKQANWERQDLPDS